MPPARAAVRVGLFAASLALGAAYWVTTHPARPGPARVATANPWTYRGSGATSIACTIVRTDGTPAVAEVSVVRATDAGAPGAGRSAIVVRGTVARGESDGRGRLSFQRLPPGAYVVIAHAAVDRGVSHAVSLWAAADVTTSREGTSAATLTLQPAASVAGRIAEIAFGSNTLRPQDVLVVLDPADATARASLLAGAPHTHPDADGAFALADVPPGHYVAHVTVGRGWTVDGIAGGGDDWIDAPARLAPGVTLAGVSVTLTDRPGLVLGTVRAADGRPAAGRLVFAFSADASRRLASRRSQAVRSDGSGRFTIEGLPGGEYFVAAADDADPTTWFTPPLFARMAGTAARIVVRAGATATANLTVR